MTKQELRNNVRKKLRECSPDELSRQSDAICEWLLRHPRVMQAGTVVAYWPLPDEPDLSNAIDALCKQGKRVLLPCVTSDTEMVLRQYDGPSSMRTGAFGIQEPIGEEADIDSPDNGTTVILVPGVAFDNNGNRLGRGKGYYDRFLQNAGRPHTIGICFDLQIVGEVPCGEHDIPVDELAKVAIDNCQKLADNNLFGNNKHHNPYIP